MTVAAVTAYRRIVISYEECFSWRRRTLLLLHLLVLFSCYGPSEGFFAVRPYRNTKTGFSRQQPDDSCTRSSVVEFSLHSFHPLGAIPAPDGTRAHFRMSDVPQQETTTTSRLDWNSRMQQLCEFRNQYGHTRVPKRYKDHPGLANWVNKQRQQYKRYQNGTRPCSLDEKRIAELEEVHFCWSGRPVKESADSRLSTHHQLEDVDWWKFWKDYQLAKDTADEVPAYSLLSKWLGKQRRFFLDHTLSEEKRIALDQVDKNWWMTRYERVWEKHFQSLVDYANQYGDCSVPITHPNQRLAHFVSNQRKQYNLRTKQRPTTMTEERMKRLESIGFAWKHWEAKNDRPLQ